jgi:hypothetical protein
MKQFMDGFMIGVLFGLIIGHIIYCINNDYKQGQVDAMTGKIKYELIIKSDSTKIWEKIK